jgi:hypothetical protein
MVCFCRVFWIDAGRGWIANVRPSGEDAVIKTSVNSGASLVNIYKVCGLDLDLNVCREVCLVAHSLKFAVYVGIFTLPWPNFNP